MRQWLRLVGMLCVAGLLCFGCGGGSHHDSGGPGGESATKVTGAAVKGMVKGGTVKVYALVEGAKSTLLGTTTTSATDGSYRVNLGTYTGPVLIEVSGGIYKDEATGVEKPLSGPLRAALGNASGGVTAAVTPLTELAVRMAEPNDGLLVDKIEDANALISELLGGNGQDDIITQVIPVDATSAEADDGSQIAQEYGLLLAAISQLAAERGVNVTEVIDELEEDLADNVLDDTGTELVEALKDFMGTDKNQTELTSADDTELDDTLESAAEEGLTPTGELAGVKQRLAAFLQEPTDANYDAFIGYVANVPASREAALFKAIAQLFALYSDNDISAFLQDAEVDDIADFKEGLNIDQIKTLVLLAANNTNVDKILAKAITRLDAADAQLAQAEGVKTSISITGYDTVYLDDIDVKVLRAFVAAFKAGLTYGQAVDLTVDTWEVDLPGNNIYSPDKVDIRDLLHNEAYEDLWDSLNGDLYYKEDEDKNDNGIDDDQDVWLSFMDNNEKFLTYRSDAAAKLDAFKTLYAAAVGRFGGVMDALDALGSDGRTKRWQNAFNISSDYDFYEMKLVQDHTLPSIQAAFTNAAAGIKLSYDEEVDERCIVIDGFAYDQETMDIYVGTHTPQGSVTLNELLSMSKSPRNLVLAALADDNYRMFSKDPAANALYADDVTWIDWEDPIETFTVPVAAITIDNTRADWEDVPVFLACGTHEIKLARDNAGRNLYLYFHVRDEFPFTLVCPWETHRRLSLSSTMAIDGGWHWYADTWISLSQSCYNGMVEEPYGNMEAYGNSTNLAIDGMVFKLDGRVIAAEYRITGNDVKAFFTPGSWNWFTWGEYQYDDDDWYDKYLWRKVKLLPEIAQTGGSNENPVRS